MNHTSLLAVLLLLTIVTDSNAQTTRAELVDAIVTKYLAVYSSQPDKIGDFHIGSSFVDRFREDGLVRIVISLPDGTQKSFDFDDRFSTAKPTKIEPLSDTTSRLSFTFGQSTVRVTSTVHQRLQRPATYQVWTIDKP
jgi:hypothetical protein